TGDDRVYVGYINYAFLAGAGYWLMIDPYGDGRAEAEITALTVSGEGFPQPSVIIKQDTADESDPFYSCKYVMISPFLWGCDDYSLSELTYELGSLRADVAVCPFPNEADMKKYGLGAPRYVVTFTRDGIDYTLRCSAKFGGVFYVIFDSIPVIYQLNTEAYFKLADMSQTSILAASPRVLNFKTVASLSVTGRGQSFAFTVARTPISADQTLFEYRVSSGGKEIGLGGFKNLLQTINESTVVEFGALAVSEEPELTITVAYHPEYERAEEVLRYFPTANRRFVCDINGQRIGAVQSLWIDRVFSGAQTAAENSEN
ncbi:MAG: DUF4340 domain-containing protein, partial [Oscillospiraceae bacterium]|nr:DUF4340 domain-containing protein [Oscillospiraceae bacterium]